VLGAKGTEKDKEDDTEARSALRRLLAAAGRADGAPVTCREPQDPGETPEPAAPAAPPATQVVAWDPPTLAAGTVDVAPAATAGEDEAAAGPAGAVHADAARHGSRVHLLLQLAAERGALPPGGDAAHAEAAAVWADPQLAWVFRPEAEGGRGLSEVPVVHVRRDNNGRVERVTGVIDRLVVREGRIDVIDYKTNRWGGDPVRRAALCDHYRPQLAAYAAAVAELHPGRTVRTWLLLTDPEGRADGDAGLCSVT